MKKDRCHRKDPTGGRHDGKIRDRILELRRVRADELVPNPSNWRRHPQSQRAALRSLLRQIGYADALIARESGGSLVLLDGHLRRSLSPDAVVPVLVLDLTDAEADTLLATLDPLSALARPDTDALAELLARVEASGTAVAKLLDSLARGAGVPVVAGMSSPDEIPSPPRQARARPGEIWALGEHRVLCGDARRAADLERLLDGEPADMLWTDPPYGVDYVGKASGALRVPNDGAGDLPDLLARSFAAIDAVLRPGAPLYVSHPAGSLSGLFIQAFLAVGWRLHQTLVWVKNAMVLGHADYHYRHEPILYGYRPGPRRRGRGHAGWYGGNDQDSVFEIPRPSASADHPTAKPVELVARCLRNSSRPGAVVLDPFGGSGSTLIACEQFGRRGYAVEIEPAYCDVVIRRWEAFTGREAVRADG